MSIKRLELECSAFDEMRGNFNAALQGTLAEMEAKQSDEATLTLKLSIAIITLSAPDPENPEGSRRIIQKPLIEHKITSAISIKHETKGTLEEECELAFDGSSYILKPLAGVQGTIYDDGDET